jgi:protein-S-isoprenylcysteine O-methyltransferase Ste14
VPPLVARLGVAVVLACWLLRVWATGYRTWVHKDGVARHLMSAGPYARMRHPLYLANGLSGAAALVVLGQLELLALYSVAYVSVTALIVRREEGALAERYGELHASYRALVPAFLPLPGRVVAVSERSGTFSWDPVHRSFELWKLLVIAGASVWFLSH